MWEKNAPCLLALLAVSSASAETPAFDRPGISFSTTTIPAGSLAWEQGLPDIEYDSAGGERSTGYSAGTNVRIGLAEAIELQVAAALFNRLETETGDGSNSDNGYGDTSLALKFALPSSRPDFSWAVLGSASFPTGDDPFTADEHQYGLGTTLGLDLSEVVSIAFYANAAYEDSDTVWTVSPSLSFSLGDRLGVYVEAGASFGEEDESDAVVAGGGLTWMLTPIVQFDVSANFGLNSDAPDVTGGVGLSVFLE
jgi:hypothetical protein